ncbi:SAM-dependent methyltransferase [Buchnera aphidicola]|uniref:RlmE family RNA methyltransferase n=1 Tax=Buchnera aphidicola TaxID=9 RepID=UPI0030EC52CF
MYKKKNHYTLNVWCKRQLKDKYVLESYQRKLRSRAWFKIDEIHQKFKIFKFGSTVIDLGSSPGSWSKYAIEKIGFTGKVISCDILPMNPIKNVIFLQGDFTKKNFFNKFLDQIIFKKVNIIISDLSANTTGSNFLDSFNSIKLNSLSLKFVLKKLKKNGFFISKIFQGNGFIKHLKKIKNYFKEVYLFKPKSSRLKSREIFIIAKKLKKYFF